MPVEAGTAEYSYVGNGSTVTFAFPSRFLTDDDIKVSLNGVEQSQSTYTVLGAGAANGGSIVFAVAPAAGVIVLLLRKPSPSQLIDFVNGQTVLEGTLDNALDRLTMVDQYALRTIDRTVRLADLDLATDMQLPIRANRIGKVLGFGAVNGEPVALDPNDAQNNRIVNLAAPTALNDAARLQDVQTQAAANGNVPLPTLAQVRSVLKATATGVFGWVQNFGTSRPAGVGAGELWVNTTTATAWVLNLFDGTDDIAVGAFNTTTNVFTPSIANNSLLPSKFAIGAWTTVASAATVDLGAQTSRNIVISGTTGITSFGSTPTPDNVPFNIRSTGAITITHSANLICPGGANLTLAAGDTFTVVQEATGVWRIIGFQRTSGIPLTPTDGCRNRIINGGMAIDQQYVGLATSVQGYCVDQWVFGSSTGTLSAQRTGTPGNYALTITSTTATTGVGIYQRLESVHIADLAGKTVTVSFTASSNSITSMNWGIGYANAVDNFSAATASGNGSFTINSTPTRYQFTTTLPSQASNGVFLNVVGGLTMAAGNTLVITNVQLEEGSVATPFERRFWAQELELCKRYYRKSYDINTAPGSLTSVGSSSTVANAGGGFRISVPFAPEMRATPSLLAYDPVSGAIGNYRDDASNTSRALNVPVLSSSGVTLYESTVASASSAVRVHYTANSRL